jgi:hypothetical protein
MRSHALAMKLLDRSDVEVMILDGFNASGTPRTINYGPYYLRIEKEDAEASADCEGRVGENIVVVGYGCY